VDGGTLVNVDVIGAVEGCLALGYDESNIIVDTVECGGHNLTAMAGDLSTLTVLPILLRAGEMDSFEGTERDYLAGTFPRWREQDEEMRRDQSEQFHVVQADRAPFCVLRVPFQPPLPTLKPPSATASVRLRRFLAPAWISVSGMPAGVKDSSII
jgi:hypothetical protein